MKDTDTGVARPPINAMPTKRLFITMLTRDISLMDAILDLVDNCVDGARREVGDGPYDDFWVKIELTGETLRIADNCGGIPVDIATNYAFRFGRDQASPSIPHSIGQFGVGMKRAIFKVGDHFTIVSRTPTSEFVVRQQVSQWAKEIEWQFQFASLQENVVIPKRDVGTILEVTSLHPDVATDFRREGFRNHLREQLRSRLTDPIARGFAVSLNGQHVHAEALELLTSSDLAPALNTVNYLGESDPGVMARFYVGLADPTPAAAAGWHVFCNGRLILEGDKTAVTGWGNSDEARLPQFHGQFNRFRGYAFFDSDDAGLLPWNTTKTGFDLDSPVYRASRLRMRTMMRPVIDFLNRLKDEKAESDVGPLQGLLAGAIKRKLDDLAPRAAFRVPKQPLVSTSPAMQRIQYSVPKEKAQDVKRHLGLPTWVAVGQYTFDYFYDAEVNDE